MGVPLVIQSGTTSLDGETGLPVFRVDTEELVELWIVWELHVDNTIHIRAITTTEARARTYLYGFKKSPTLQETVRRMQVEHVYANHLYAESMYAYGAAKRSASIVAEEERDEK